MKKAVNIEVKISLQSLLRMKKIDTKYLKDYKLAKKDKTN